MRRPLSNKIQSIQGRSQTRSSRFETTSAIMVKEHISKSKKESSIIESINYQSKVGCSRQ
ncbi:unnamed protein product [Rhodiola kirilowii]